MYDILYEVHSFHTYTHIPAHAAKNTFLAILIQQQETIRIEPWPQSSSAPLHSLVRKDGKDHLHPKNIWTFPEMGGTPQLSVSMGLSIMNNPFWVPPSMETPIFKFKQL